MAHTEWAAALAEKLAALDEETTPRVRTLCRHGAPPAAHAALARDAMRAVADLVHAALLVMPPDVRARDTRAPPDADWEATADAIGHGLRRGWGGLTTLRLQLHENTWWVEYPGQEVAYRTRSAPVRLVIFLMSMLESLSLLFASQPDAGGLPADICERAWGSFLFGYEQVVRLEIQQHVFGALELECHARDEAARAAAAERGVALALSAHPRLGAGPLAALPVDLLAELGSRARHDFLCAQNRLNWP